MGRFSVTHGEHAGHAATILHDVEAALEATFLPGVGMVGASLSHHGEELLGRTENLARWAAEGSTMGIPLLHPWANRLGGHAYASGGVEVALDPASPLLHGDANGLPIHGVASARLPWQVAHMAADDAGAELVAVVDFASEELLAVFPFPHRLEQTIRLDEAGLTVRTAVTATAEQAVPLSFGYHPYLQLPGATRADLRVTIPPLERLLLDERSLPTGERETYPGLDGPLDRAYDDGFAGAAEGSCFRLAGGGRIVSVEFLDGYPFAQVYAPLERDFVSFEPMTAPANALVSGDHLRVVPPGETFAAAFRIAVDA